MNAKIDKNTTTVWIVSYRNFPNCLNKLPIIEQVYTESIVLCKGESEWARPRTAGLNHVINSVVIFVNNKFTISNQIIDDFIQIIKDWRIIFEANRPYFAPVFAQ